MKQKKINYTYWNAAVRVSEGDLTRISLMMNKKEWVDYVNYTGLKQSDPNYHDLCAEAITEYKFHHGEYLKHEILNLLLMHELTNNPQD